MLNVGKYKANDWGLLMSHHVAPALFCRRNAGNFPLFLPKDRAGVRRVSWLLVTASSNHGQEQPSPHTRCKTPRATHRDASGGLDKGKNEGVLLKEHILTGTEEVAAILDALIHF